MSLSAIVRALINAGATPDMILAAVEADEKARAEKEDRLRQAARIRKAKSRENNNRVTVTCVTDCDIRDNSSSPLVPPSDGFPDPSLTPPYNPPITKKPKARVEKPKISLEELSVDHNAEWLAKKRSEGRYLQHDEHFVLEQFTQYCKSKGIKYADYLAAYRNSFEWDKCKPVAKRGDPASNAFNAAQSIIARRNAAAGISGDAKPANHAFAADIRVPDHLR